MEPAKASSKAQPQVRVQEMHASKQLAGACDFHPLRSRLLWEGYKTCPGASSATGWATLPQGMGSHWAAPSC